MPRREETERMRENTERLRTAREQEERDVQAREERLARLEASAEARSASEASYGAVQTSTQQLERDRDLYEWFRAKLDFLNERNITFQNFSADRIAAQILLLVAPFGIGIIDTVLLSSASREIVKNVSALFGGDNRVGPVAVLGLAISYLAMELVIGFQLNGERRGSPDGGTTRNRIFAVGAWLALPLAVVLFSLVTAGVFSGEAVRSIGHATWTAALFRAGVLGFLALITHSFVLLFGGHIVRAYGYAFYKLKQFWLGQRMNRLELAIGGGITSVGRDFRGFYNGLNGAGADGVGNGQAGPLDERSRRVTKDVFGYDVIEEPEKPGANRARPGEEPPRRSQDPRPAAPPEAGTEPSRQDTRQTHAEPEIEGETETGPDGSNFYNMDGEDELRRD